MFFVTKIQKYLLSFFWVGIPKCFAPESPAECRNISCTNYLSKVYEGCVLDWARQQISIKDNQFGGEKNCGTTHLLASTLDTITEALEDRRAACVLTAIDFSKAFNRLDHLSCLRAFERKGAGENLLELLAAFLLGRTMTVRVGKEWSARKPVNAGSPQGSVLGGFLFNVGIDHLEDGCHFPNMPFFDQHIETSSGTADYPAASTPARISSFVEEPAPSPIHATGPDSYWNQEWRTSHHGLEQQRREHGRTGRR